MKRNQIIDEIQIVNEIDNDARRRKKYFKKIKVCFKKAYSFDLEYLDVVTLQMKFPIKWRKWFWE